ncbi:hypothetical protein N0V93_009431 [Gnomoniopsis smithogilvyi]|uniref:Uncharacterized protein n=1 Tax=Gnomoniopsis smithogilvyi TaxID=1191159 RepID=A0A9W9CTS7_9PEZI|nr:hypothetical protein N0V93_009431 [Gnomoniopsis smithogilvyi]
MQRTGSLLVKYGGSTPLGSLPAAFKTGVETASKSIESNYPKVTEAVIQGSQPHKSHKDKNDEKEVITVSYHTEKGTRVTSIHVHEDQTWKEFPSRNASKGK